MTLVSSKVKSSMCRAQSRTFSGLNDSRALQKHETQRQTITSEQTHPSTQSKKVNKPSDSSEYSVPLFMICM